jgi:hypothetical protein
MSRSFLTFLDEVLLPSSLMIFSKFIGVFITIFLFDVNWSLKEYTNDLFIFGATKNLNDAMIITTYSDLFMYLAMAMFFSFSVIRAIFFHDTHISQDLLYKLTVNNLSNLVKSSFIIYKAASVWLVFTIIANLIIIVNIAQGKSFVWSGIITTLVTIGLGIILLGDVVKEIKAQRKIKN